MRSPAAQGSARQDKAKRKDHPKEEEQLGKRRHTYTHTVTPHTAYCTVLTQASHTVETRQEGQDRTGQGRAGQPKDERQPAHAGPSAWLPAAVSAAAAVSDDGRRRRSSRRNRTRRTEAAAAAAADTPAAAATATDTPAAAPTSAGISSPGSRDAYGEPREHG